MPSALAGASWGLASKGSSCAKLGQWAEGLCEAAMTRGTSGHPRIVVDGRCLALLPLPFKDPETTEDWLQRQLDQNPGLLPIDEISSAWGPLVSLGREIPLPVGFIDNLFVSPAGEVTVVEAKLWRNPEARRQVIGQILDYAAALAAMSYEGLEQAVIEARPQDRRPIWQRICEEANVATPDAEPMFIDTVSRNLHEGRFLLLIVGDGIRSDLESMAELLGAHPSLGFHLELVEMRIYQLPTEGSLLVVPSMIGRTTEVRRATVSVKRDERGEVSIIVEAPPVEPPRRGEPIASLEEFVTRSTELVGQPQAEAMASIVEWWRTERGSPIKFNRQSITLESRSMQGGGGRLSVASLYVDGLIQGSVAPMTKTRGIVSNDEALEHYRAAGFVGDPDWPSLDGDPTQADQRARLLELLAWADELIRTADRSDPPKVG